MKSIVSWNTFAEVTGLVFFLVFFWLVARPALAPLLNEQVTEGRYLETITRGFPIAGDTCRAPGFVLTDGVVLQTPDLAEFFYAGELTFSAPPGSVTIMVLNSLARDGRRFRIIAVPIETK